jgi:hypothetical protein
MKMYIQLVVFRGILLVMKTKLIAHLMMSEENKDKSSTSFVTTIAVDIIRVTELNLM